MKSKKNVNKSEPKQFLINSVAIYKCLKFCLDNRDEIPSIEIVFKVSDLEKFKTHQKRFHQSIWN